MNADLCPGLSTRGYVAGVRILELERIVVWGNEPGGGMLGVCVPFYGKPAIPGNGSMAGICAGSPREVERVHARALELGGSAEGAQDDRGNGFYAGCFRDPDGNKLVAYHLA